MNIPVEIIVLMLSANGAFLSLLVHLLISIKSSLSSMQTANEVDKAKTEAAITQLKIDRDRHEAELSRRNPRFQGG